MALNDVLQQFDKIPRRQKLAILAGVVVLVAGAYWYFLFEPLGAEVSALNQQIQQLQQEKADYESKKQRYMAFRAEVKKLLQEKKELVKVLPTNAEIPSFLQSLHSQAELAGLNIMTFDKQAEMPRDFYSVIPVNMVISGTYHQIEKFFYSVGQLRRIVNIQDVLLGDAEDRPSGVMLKAKFVASTFRFIEQSVEAGAPGAAPAPPTPPGGGHG